jgi:hypothetical protein
METKGYFSGTLNFPSEEIELGFLLTLLPIFLSGGTMPVRKNNALQNILWFLVYPNFMYPNNI